MNVPVPCAIVLVPISACIVAGEPSFVSTHLLGCSLVSRGARIRTKGSRHCR